MKIAIYTRLSEDRDGQQTATARQEADCRKFAEAKGWTVTGVYEDVDISAYRRKLRPGYEALLEAVRVGEVEGVLVWKLDRLVRHPAEFERFWAVCEARGAVLASVNESFDTSSEIGLVIVRILVAFARLESANISIRQRSKQKELAGLGRFNGGGHRPFGYTLDRTSIVVEEAAALRAAVPRILAGESLRAICRDWAAAGILTTTGGRWQVSPLRRALSAAMLSGQREHHGEIVAKGTWPAIITPEETEAVRVVLRDKGRRTSPTNARSYLLSGFLRCGKCGQPMVARPRGDKVRRYVCSLVPGAPNCGAMAILAQPLEDLVAEMVVIALDSPELAAAVAANATGDKATAVTRIRDTEAQLEQLARDFYTEQLITRSEFFAARDALNARIEEARRQLAGDVLGEAIAAGALVRESWEGAAFDWRRRLTAALLDYIEIGSAVRGRNTFDATRVRPVWKY